VETQQNALLTGGSDTHMTVLAGGLASLTQPSPPQWRLTLPRARLSPARYVAILADQALTHAYHAATRIPFDDASRFVFLSDCHRGDGGYADEFARNEDIYLDALTHYAGDGFTYVELGDGDELWKNHRPDDLRRAHRATYALLESLHRAGRCHVVWGNHNPGRPGQDIGRRPFDALIPTSAGLPAHVALLFQHRVTGARLFATHGHQADPISHQMAALGKFVVGRMWKSLQWFGFRDPTCRPENAAPSTGLEQRLAGWVRRHRHPLICGHTHRPHFPRAGETAYFNTGSCVHPRAITAIELQAGTLALVCWQAPPPSGGRRFERARRTLMAPSLALGSLR
jgi:predicted phosphodiesterase